jgi:hypothetical protein
MLTLCTLSGFSIGSVFTADFFKESTNFCAEAYTGLASFRLDAPAWSSFSYPACSSTYGGSGVFIPGISDPDFFIPNPGIRKAPPNQESGPANTKLTKCIQPKKLYYALRNVKKTTGSRIRIRNTLMACLMFMSIAKAAGRFPPLNSNPTG